MTCLMVPGLMAACTLVALHNITAEEALYRVQASFDTRGEIGEGCLPCRDTAALQTRGFTSTRAWLHDAYPAAAAASIGSDCCLTHVHGVILLASEP